MPTTPTDLLALMQAGDLLALDRFAREYGHQLLALARRQCHLAADAEDAVQLALLSASTAMTGIRADGSPIAWLSTLVARHCYRMNQQAHATDELTDVPCHCDDASSIAERRQLAARVGEALMTLPRSDRLLFLLSVEGFNSVELAERFDLSSDAVRSRLKRARQLLRATVQPDDTLERPKSTEGSNANPSTKRSPHDHDSPPPARHG